MNRGEDLTAGAVRRHLVRLTVPMFLGISSMIVASMIDTIYIGWIGTLELAAVSMTFPLVMGLSSVSMGLGVGATSIMSRTLGSGDRNRSLVLGSHTLVLVAVLVMSLAIAGWFNSQRMFELLGADATILPLAAGYIHVWFIGLPLFALPMVAMSMLRALGNARTPGALMVGGAFMQVLLAPALIFGVPGISEGIGYLGSAWAFVISRAITCAATAVVLARAGMFQRLGSVASVLQSWREVLRIGVPSVLTNMIGPASMGVIFSLLSRHGPAVIAGFGVAVRIESLALMILMALSASVNPVVGQNFGAKRYDRIGEAVRLGYRFAIAWGAFATIFFAMFGDAIVGLINDDPAVVEATYWYLLLVPVSYALMGMSMIASSCFVALGRPTPSLLLALMRMLVLYVPLAWLADAVWGYRGIFVAGSLCTAIVAGAAHWWMKRTVPMRLEE